MIYELRTYDLKVGRTADYLDIFGRMAYPLIARYADPVGFWSTGPTGSGFVDQVHHIWAYVDLETRHRQRSRLYSDPTWTKEVMPAVFDTLERLHGRLLLADPAFDDSLRSAMGGSPLGPVLARWSGCDAEAPAGAFAGFRAFTGQTGEALHLRSLQGATPEPIPVGAVQEIWIPAAFSRIR